MAATTYHLAGRDCLFGAWRVDLGKVFDRPYALDVETTSISADEPWEAPQYVLGAACDGHQGFFLPGGRALAFLEAHADVPVVFHHAPFDLKVLDRLAHEQSSGLDVYRLVECDNVWDTLLLHRLYCLGSEGHAALGQASLDHCVKTYLGCTLPKDVRDAAGRDVRTSFGRYLRRPPREVEPVYLEYLAKDALATALVFDVLTDRLATLLRSSAGTWGYVSAEWLDGQVARWGPQTHHLQLKAAVALDAVTAAGIGVDVPERDRLVREVEAELKSKEAKLAGCSYRPGPGSAKALQDLVAAAVAKDDTLEVPRTATGKYATSKEALARLAGKGAFFKTLQEYQAAGKLLQTYLKKMGRPRLHPRFDVLKSTGRTSSSGDLNAQNLPRDDRVRRCFVPAAGHVYLDADYATVELATLAQAVQGQFGRRSAMAEAINAGRDLHRLVAARVTGKPEAEVTATERSKAKPINFGKPGGMGSRGLRDYARAGYGIELSMQEVARLEDAWFALFPEMEDFLGQDQDIGLLLADRLGLTLAGYDRTTGRERYSRDAGCDEPAAWLGRMCLKVLQTAEPRTASGVPHTAEQVGYFWGKARALAGSLKPHQAESLRRRRPGEALYKAVRDLAGRAGVFTLTGRLRAGASYCARHNTVFQGLAADGAKLALWRLWRAGHRVVNFIHDQVLVEVNSEEDLAAVAADVEGIMVAAMREVVPDAAVMVEWAYRSRWSKRPDDQVKVADRRRPGGATVTGRSQDGVGGSCLSTKAADGAPEASCPFRPATTASATPAATSGPVSGSRRRR